MKFSLEKSEKHTIFIIEEEKLDATKTADLKAEFVTQFQSGVKNLILDLSEVRYVDSSGLSAILMAQRLSKEVKGLLIIVGAGSHVMKLITISKLDSVLEILPTRTEAIDFVFLHEIEKDLEDDE